jgi:L-methionine (R)-S-oxide reductase
MWQVNANYEAENFYPTLEKELLALIAGEKNLIANLANICSWINHAFPELNWCGFYLWNDEDQELVLGPFQGRPACIRIKADRGVCGAAYRQSKAIRVDDVHTFPGHIACDSASRSELVVPLVKDGLVKGVLDLDSPRLGRFTERDENEFSRIIGILTNQIYN